jgi:hypothetical protein
MLQSRLVETVLKLGTQIILPETGIVRLKTGIYLYPHNTQTFPCFMFNIVWGQYFARWRLVIHVSERLCTKLFKGWFKHTSMTILTQNYPSSCYEQNIFLQLHGLGLVNCSNSELLRTRYIALKLTFLYLTGFYL